MSFQSPWFLLGLVAIPLALALLALARRRPERYVVRFPAAGTVATVLGAGSRLRRILPTALLCLALAGLAIALARPEATIAVPNERASVMLVTDTSGSMNAGDVEPSRMDAARAAGERFLDEVPDRLQVGLVGYADGTHTVLRPTAEHAQVRAALDGLRAEGGTATGEALASAVDAFGERGEDPPPAAIVLISDGATTSGRDPVDVAEEARALGIPVSTVALGTPDGMLELPDGRTQAVPPDPQSLQRIAEVSGGRAFTAADAGSLEEVYEDLGSRIGTREETREITAGFAGAAILLLAGALGTALRWRGRLP
jgi:Ca-activated chloride channel family protein